MRMKRLTWVEKTKNGETHMETYWGSIHSGLREKGDNGN